MLWKSLSVLFNALALSGCSAFQAWYGETKPMMTYAELPSSAKLFVWSPKNNAAFVNHKSQGCVQSADVFHEKSGSLDISNDLLAVVKGIALSPSTSNQEKLIALRITNEIVGLKTNTERNTYLSIGMFGLCQLYANGGMSQAELLALVSKMLDNSLLLGKDNASLKDDASLVDAPPQSGSAN